MLRCQVSSPESVLYLLTNCAWRASLGVATLTPIRHSIMSFFRNHALLHGAGVEKQVSTSHSILFVFYGSYHVTSKSLFLGTHHIPI